MIKTVKIKANAKINIGLNILGRGDGFHMLDTVVAGINMYDTVTLKTRKDDLINLTVKGQSLDNIAIADNNVYKAAKAFKEQFGTKGADITLKKDIPVGSGLGGSSADIVATVKAMAKAYETEGDVIPLIRSLCSDGEFLTEPGFARLNQRGSVVERFDGRQPIYLVICLPEYECVTKDVFSEFDRGEYSACRADIGGIADSIKSGQPLPAKAVFNALYEPAAKLNGEILRAYELIRSLSPDFYSMSGSGCAVYGAFSSVEMCLWAREKLEREFTRVYVKETI